MLQRNIPIDARASTHSRAICLRNSNRPLNLVLVQPLIAASCEAIEDFLFLSDDHRGRAFEPIGRKLLSKFDVDMPVFTRPEFP